MKNPEQTVAVVDDDPLVVNAIVRLLDSDGYKVASFATPAEFLSGYDPGQTGCVLLDLTMPELSGLDVQNLLVEAGGAPPIIFLTGTGNIQTTVKAMKLGAVDFLTKPVEESALLKAVERALESHRAARQERFELTDLRTRLNKLTPREREVFEQVISGRLNKQIAADLGTSEKTIKIHRARVMEKLQADSVAQLVHLAQRAGLPAPSFD
jgi:FixJ family two-component response regulator